MTEQAAEVGQPETPEARPEPKRTDGRLSLEDAAARLEKRFKAPASPAQPEAAASDASEPAAAEEGTEPEAVTDAAEVPAQTDETTEPRHTVKVDGEEKEVTLSELKRGFQFNGHNTRTAQALAKEKQAVEAERAEATKLREEYTRRLEQLTAQQPAGNEAAEPDWVKLAEELDPWEYQRQRARYDAQQLQRYRANAEAEAERQRQYGEWLRKEQAELARRIPEAKDAKAWDAARAAIVTTGSEYGLSGEDLGRADSRLLHLLRDHARVRAELAALKSGAKPAAAKATAQPPRASLPPGTVTAPQSEAQRSHNAVRDRFRNQRSISKADFAAILAGNFR